MLSRFKNICNVELDLRALALFRILMGLILFIDLINRYFNLNEHYSNTGVLPASVWSEMYKVEWLFTFHLFDAANGPLLIIQMCLALALMLGFFSKITLFLSWVCVLSLQNRNPAVLFGADTVIRVAMFWGLFLPLGKMYSIDSWWSRRRGRALKATILPAAAQAITFQVFCIYFFAAVLKFHPVWYRDFTAMIWSVQMDYITTPFAFQLAALPTFLKVLTGSVLFLEFFAPFLLFAKKQHAHLRVIAIFSLIFFHVGTALLYRLGIFPWICSALLVALLPPEFFKTVAPKISSVTLTVKEKFLSGVLYALAASVLAMNIASVTENIETSDYSKAFKIFRPIGLFQSWALFAPHPDHTSWWIYARATLPDSTVINPMQQKVDVNGNRPKDFRAAFGDTRWTAYLSSLMRWETALRTAYGQYLCRQIPDQAASKISIFTKIRDNSKPYQRYHQWTLYEGCCENSGIKCSVQNYLGKASK